MFEQLAEVIHKRRLVLVTESQEMSRFHAADLNVRKSDHGVPSSLHEGRDCRTSEVSCCSDAETKFPFVHSFCSFAVVVPLSVSFCLSRPISSSGCSRCTSNWTHSCASVTISCLSSLSTSNEKDKRASFGAYETGRHVLSRVNTP